MAWVAVVVFAIRRAAKAVSIWLPFSLMTPVVNITQGDEMYEFELSAYVDGRYAPSVKRYTYTYVYTYLHCS